MVKTHMQRLNNMLLKKKRIKKELKEEIRNLETNENKNLTFQNLGHSKCRSTSSR